MCLVVIVVLELCVVMCFIFVLINGVFGFIKGIVWCCMFVFINVWFELLFFKNGIYVVVVEIICFGDIFI